MSLNSQPESQDRNQPHAALPADHQLPAPAGSQPGTEAAPQHAGEKHPEPPAVSGGLIALVVVLLLAVAAAFAIFGILHRKKSTKDLGEYTAANSAPPVTLTMPTVTKSASEIVLPGNIQAYSLAPIYARTTGYVKAWYHDIGSHVSKGELLATIETPELDQQLAQAKADLATAQSNAGIAKTTADRYKDLIGVNAVSQQDTDNAVQAQDARNTQVTSAQANVKRLEELQGFERIESPFDGVVTARNLDVGQLITASGSTTSPGAGTITGNKEIFDIAAVQTLRVFVNVPQVYSPDAKNGVMATLTLPQYPGKTFTGKLVRSSNAVDPTTRTLLAEVDVPNGAGLLLPGSYTEVHLNVSNPAPALIVPVSALILDADGLHVAVVDANNKAHIMRVVPGRDSGATIEILSGLQQGQAVIANPPDSIIEGQTVRVVSGGNPAQPTGGK